MRLGTAALLIAGWAALAGCSAAPGGVGPVGPGGYDYGYYAVPAPVYGYGGPAFVGGYGGGGWYRGDNGDWRQREWWNGGASPQQAERALQEQRNAALLRQQALQNQASVQENRMRTSQQVQEYRMRSIQQAREAQAAYQRQRQEAQKKALGQQ